MESLVIWLTLACLVYTLLFIIVFNGVYSYEEGGFRKSYLLLVNKISRLKQDLRLIPTNYFNTLAMLRKLLLK